MRHLASVLAIAAVGAAVVWLFTVLTPEPNVHPDPPDSTVGVTTPQAPGDEMAECPDDLMALSPRIQSCRAGGLYGDFDLFVSIFPGDAAGLPAEWHGHQVVYEEMAGPIVPQ